MSKVSPLSEVLGYSQLLNYYKENKDKPWQEWLTFDRTFEKPGKQGLVGIMKPTDPEKKEQFVFKISQYINYLTQHEEVVMKSLNELSAFCPHFCKSVGTITCKVDPKSRKIGNPFEIKSKYPIEKEVLLCEYIDKSCKFYNYIRSTKIHEDVLYSTIKQVLMATLISQKKKRFSHYDLHSFNIMMRKCKEDIVFLYVINEENQFAVPTHGHYPVIIDFGFSYIQELDDGPLWPSMGHTDVGFMSDRYDWVADPKLFLVSVSTEIKDKRNTKRSKRLRRMVRNIFFPLKIDWESGWDDLNDHSASDYVTEMLEEYNEVSTLFEEYDHYCIDLLQSLIILPLEENSYSDIGKIYQTFLEEWVKIENEITNPFYNLYILKGVVDAARFVRAAYTHKKTRTQSVITFRNAVYGRISEVSKFCVPKELHCEKLLCSMIMFAKNVEGIFHDVITTRMIEKNKEYAKLPLKSTEQIYAAVETNLPDNYKYSENTTICVFDCMSEKTDMLKLTTEQANVINEIHPLCKGTSLYDIFKGKSPV